MTEIYLTAERGKFRPAQPSGDELSVARFATAARGVNLANWSIHPNNGLNLPAGGDCARAFPQKG